MSKKIRRVTFQGNEEQGVSRKQFLKGAATTAAGITLVGGLGSILTGCEPDGTGEAAENGEIETPEHPYPFEKLDPDAVADRAFDGYKEGIGDGGGG